MSEISILIKDLRIMTLPEYKGLDRYASPGRAWVVIDRNQPSVTRFRSLEYIFEEENFFMYKLISSNILAQWFTENTRRMRFGDEYQLDHHLFIKLHSYGYS